MEEGYIKYHCQWNQTAPFTHHTLKELIEWRNFLYQHGLIGMYPDGIGFGNVSIRYKNNLFFITGSATGHITHIEREHISLVLHADVTNNVLTCEGPVKASSESLSHAVIYESVAAVNAVVHIHHKPTWERWIHQLPTTDVTASYGTPQMAEEIKKILHNPSQMKEQIIIMGGHEEGIITFGNNLKEAVTVLMKHIIDK
ncbi:MAG: class II aldolase/adducin family protein [Microbacter sp.]